jgi:Xaa-Pro aminopeptidase
MPYAQLQSFYQAFKGITFVDADHVLAELRMTKTQNEYQQMQRASRIVSRVFGCVSGFQSYNLSERDFDALLDRQARLEGAEDFRLLIGKPLEKDWNFRPVEDRPFAGGDTVVIYAAAQFERYWSESIRTFKVEDNHLIASPLEACFAEYDRIIGGLEPGKLISQFYQETLSELKKDNLEYIGDYGLGQGIGQSLEEFPWINQDTSIQLNTGNCLAFRLAIRDKTLGAVVIGDTVFLSAGGPQILTR